MIEPSLVLRTRERAAQDGLGFTLRPDAELLGELRTPQEPAKQINFLTLASARLFVAELDLAQVDVLGAEHEDVHALLAAIRGDAPATVH